MQSRDPQPAVSGAMRSPEQRLRVPRGAGFAAAWALVWLSGSTASGAVLEGELSVGSNFAEFVGKFCYDYREDAEAAVGELIVDALRLHPHPATPNGKLYFMIFDDERSHWKKARRSWDTSTCEEKAEDASLYREIDLNTDNPEFSYDIHIKEHLRPRFWYFAFVGCGIEGGLQMRYKLHATNDIRGWQMEFSLDHMGLFNVHMVFSVLFFLATSITACASRWRPSARGPSLRDHPYIKLLMISYFASLASCTFFLVHYGLFVNDGFGSKRIRFLGVLASIVANCTIFLIAILSSVGWAISTPVLPNRRGFLGLVALVGGLNAFCELHAEIYLDQSTRLYSYQSSPGMLSLIMRVFMFCWFAFQIMNTHELEAQIALRHFYKFLGISISGWSMNVPVMVLLAFFVSPWYRYKVVVGVELAARFVAQALLSRLFCGPLSPISAENTFTDRDAGLDAGFDPLNDSKNYDNL